jgi:hypothetical protein
MNQKDISVQYNKPILFPLLKLKRKKEKIMEKETKKIWQDTFVVMSGV